MLIYIILQQCIWGQKFQLRNFDLFLATALMLSPLVKYIHSIAYSILTETYLNVKSTVLILIGTKKLPTFRRPLKTRAAEKEVYRSDHNF